MSSSQPYVNLLPLWPSLQWMREALLQEQLCFVDVPYDKLFRLNQYEINTITGLQKLSVPLVGGRGTSELISKVQISYAEPWVRTHLGAIVSAYGKAPYFDELWPQIEALYVSGTSDLFGFSSACLQAVYRWLRTPCIFTASSEALIPCQANHSFSYMQVFQHQKEVAAHTSVLDLVMCAGPQAKRILLHS